MTEHNLYQASHQWATRPDDERFESLESVKQFWTDIERGTKVVDIDSDHFRTDNHDGEIVAVGQRNIPAKFSHTGFEHLCQAVDFPAYALRKLEDSPTLVMNILNNRLKAKPLDGWKMVAYQNGDVRARALVSEKYGFISNTQVVNGLMQAQGNGWRIPPARPARAGQPGTRRATETDILNDSSFGLSVNVGDLIAPAGIYSSWDDMFIFMVNENRRLSNGLARGVFIWNNGVKARKFEVLSFMYNHVCGNHIVWGASEVKKHTIRHIGENAEYKAIRELRNVVSVSVNASAEADEQRLKAAKDKLLGSNDEEVIDLVYTQKGWVTKTQAELALEIAEEHPEDHGDSDPKSVWGFVNGLTRLSQASNYADQRTALDMAAGKILETVF